MNRFTRGSGLRTSVAAVALAAAALPAAQAETSPYYFGARETLTRDTNVFRTPEGTSDWISSTGVFAGLDQPISRQRLRANVAADWNRYRNVEALNHTSGSGLVRLDWETIGHLSGDAQLSHSQDLYREYVRATDAQNKTVVRTTAGAFNARLGVVTAWTVEAGVFGNRTRYRGSVSNANDLDYDGYRAGVRYTPSSLWTLGVGARHADGKYPNARTALEFTRKDIDLYGTWRPTGTSTLDGWLSRSRWSYPQSQARSDALTTGTLRYQYRPGGRLSMDAVLKRDSSAGEYGFDTLAVVDNQVVLANRESTNTRITNSFALNANYQLTGKTSLSAGVQRATRKVDNALTQTVAGLPTNLYATARDRTSSANLQANWDATRWLRVGCGITHVHRSVLENSAGLTYPYSVNMTSCTAQVALQP